jgi:serine O-acetyltransferase
MADSPHRGCEPSCDQNTTQNAKLAWRGVLALIKADIRRRLVLEGKSVGLANALCVTVMPGVVCVVAYRISNALYSRGHRILARIIDDLQYLYTGVELHFGSIIGPGLVLGDRPGGGLSEHVTIGKNCTILGGSTMTLNAHGIDLSKGRIVLGDYCVVGVGARIIGAVTIADGTQIKPNAVVLLSSLAIGGILEGIPAQRKSVVPIDLMACWNPLKAYLMLSRDPAAEEAS